MIFFTDTSAHADRTETYIKIGLIYSQLRSRVGKYSKAESAYRTPMKIQPSFFRSYVNLAGLWRMQGRDAYGERMPGRTLEVAPRNADVHHALGLLLIRRNRVPEAMSALKESVKLSPDNTRYSYVYAVALNDTGEKSESIRVLEEAHKRRPADREVLYAIINFNSENGDIQGAIVYAEKLIEISPDSPEAARLLDELKRESNR